MIHSLYISLKEFSRVICGVLLSVPETMEDLNAMKRLWVHEVRICEGNTIDMFVQVKLIGISLFSLFAKPNFINNHQVFRVYHDRLVEETDRAAYISTIRNICTSRLKVDFNALCKNVAAPASKTVENKDLGKLLFCDFGETKNDDKFYKEVSNIDTFRLVFIS